MANLQVHLNALQDTPVKELTAEQLFCLSILTEHDKKPNGGLAIQVRLSAEDIQALAIAIAAQLASSGSPSSPQPQLQPNPNLPEGAS